MKVKYRVTDSLWVEIESDTQRDMFEELSQVEEVFSHNTCGKCGKNNVRFSVRNDKDENKYYEVKCLDCFARLSFGANKKGGGLFPRRKDPDGNWLPDGGWMKWDKNQKKMV